MTLHIWARGRGMHAHRHLYPTFCNEWVPLNEIVNLSHAIMLDHALVCKECWDEATADADENASLRTTEVS